MDLITELRNTADLAHAVTGCSLRNHPCTLAANEIERLREALRPLAECQLPSAGFEQHGVTAHFTTEQIIAAKNMTPNVK